MNPGRSTGAGGVDAGTRGAGAPRSGDPGLGLRNRGPGAPRLGDRVRDAGVGTRGGRGSEAR
jgi:hypothetical protein